MSELGARAVLERRLAEVAANAAADRLEDVRIKGDELKITPLKAATPEEVDALADRLYGMIPNLRITSLIAEVDRWTGFSSAFTHLHSGAPADDRRIVLTRCWPTLPISVSRRWPRPALSPATGSSPGPPPGIYARTVVMAYNP